MVTINIVAQSGHAWTETCNDRKSAKERAREVAKEHGDIERVELLTQDGPEDIWVCEWSKAASTLGRRGGSSTSKAKQQASRANGQRGGRPRKTE